MLCEEELPVQLTEKANGSAIDERRLEPDGISVARMISEGVETVGGVMTVDLH